MATKTQILACDVLNQAAKNASPLTDDEIQTLCPTCNVAITLADCKVSQGRATTYSHTACGSTILIVSGTHGAPTGPGSGYRLGHFLLRNVTELTVRRKGFPRALRIPASPNALAKGTAEPAP